MQTPFLPTTLTFEAEAEVATIMLRRPDARNALSRLMAQELLDCIDRVREGSGIRAVVLTGAGGHFCAGGDMRAVSSDDGRSVADRLEAMDLYGRLASELMNLGIPVVAAVDGVAYGAGFSLALLCDIVLVTPRARLCMVFHRMGRIPDLAALYTLPRIVGVRRAKDLVLSAREIDAHEALRIGVATEIVAAEGLSARAHAIAAALARGPALAMRVSKQALNQSLDSSFETLLQIEAAGQAVASASDFGKEAARRFVAKQAPLFQWPLAERSE
ncbi:MAG: enoyl-CoA hydratase/isomerase family protein [Devosia sp.]